jgi:hypothetical protein
MNLLNYVDGGLSTYPTLYNLNFQAPTTTTSGTYTYMGVNTAGTVTHIPQWTYSSNDGYFYFNKSGIGFATSPSNQAFLFYGSNSAKTMTHNGFPLKAGNYQFTFRVAGNASNSPSPSFLVSVNNGASYTTVFSSIPPYYLAGSTPINTTASLYTSPTVNVPTDNTIRIRFTCPASTTFKFTMIDDIQIFQV